MKKIILRLAAVLMLFVLCLSLTACESETVVSSSKIKPTEEFFVNDFANVIDEADERAIYEKGAQLDKSTSAQVVVVTVNSVGNEEISEYALNVGRNWGVGDKEKNNGIVILLAAEDRDVYISVGYGLEGAMPDSKTGRILDEYGVDYFSADEFSKGLVAVYNAVYNEVLIEYGVAPDKDYVPLDELEEDGSGKKVLISWIVLIVVLAIYFAVFRRRGFFFIGGPPFGGGSFGGGSFGGRSGGSFGGGGFSGGGGSFGGGGAGRSF